MEYADYIDLGTALKFPPPPPPSQAVPRALEFAQEYDLVAKLINAIVNHRHEISDLVTELRGAKPLILEELAEASPETRELLVEVGALGKE